MIDQRYFCSPISDPTSNEGPPLPKRVAAYDAPIRGDNYLKSLERFPCNYIEFYYPADYFFIKNETLYCLGLNHFSIRLSELNNPQNQSRIASKFGEAWIVPALMEVRDYLNYFIEPPLQKKSVFSNYYFALMEFKYKHNLTCFPLFDQYDNIKLFNGRLFGHVHNIQPYHANKSSSGSDAELKLEFLTYPVVKSEIKLLGGKIPPNGSISSLNKLIKKLIPYHEDEGFATEDTPTEILYKDGKIVYSLDDNKSFLFPEPEKLNCNYENCLIPLGLNSEKMQIKPTKISDNFRTSLYDLAGGTLEGLNDIAELFARLYSNSLPSKYLWNVSGPSCDLFCSWIKRLCTRKIPNSFRQNTYPYTDIGTPAVSSTAFTKDESKRMTELAKDAIFGVILQCNDKPIDSRSINYKNLSIIIKGGDIGKLNDSCQPQKNINYSPVVMLLTEKPLANNNKEINIKHIYLPDSWNNSLSFSDTLWIKTCLVSYGLSLIHSQNTAQRPKMKGENREENVRKEEVFRKFYEDYCVKPSDSVVTRSDVLEKLSRYCNSLNPPINLKNATKDFKMFVHLNELQCTHSNKSETRGQIAIENFEINVNKLDDAIRKNLHDRQVLAEQRSKEAFDKCIDAITSTLNH